MVFTAKSSKINIEEVRALSKLEGQALERKSQRDQELEAIIRGEDQRILLVMGHAHLTTKKLSLNTLSVWQSYKKKWQIVSLWLCVFILPNPVPTEMAIRA